MGRPDYRQVGGGSESLIAESADPLAASVPSFPSPDAHHVVLVRRACDIRSVQTPGRLSHRVVW